MGDRRHDKRVAMAGLVLGLATALAACTPSVPESRVDSGGEAPGDQAVTSEATGVSTTVAPTTMPEGKAATNAANICRGRADSFIPDKIAGFTVAASGDITGTLPSNAAKVQSAGAALARPVGGGKDGLVSAVVFEEQPGLSAVVSAAIDLVMQAAGGKADVTDTLVNGYEARTISSPNGATVIAWSECLNVWMIVQAPDAQTAADLAAKVHSQ